MISLRKLIQRKSGEILLLHQLYPAKHLFILSMTALKRIQKRNIELFFEITVKNQKYWKKNFFLKDI